MKKLLFVMLCMLLGMPPCCAQAKDELTIVHVTDTHYLSPSLTDYGEPFMNLIRGGDGKATHYTPAIVQAFADEMLTLRPDAVIISGDLTFNGAAQSHADLAALLLPLTDAGIKVLALPGNHDVNSTGCRFEGDRVYYTESLAGGDFAGVYAQFGYADALSRDTASMSYTAPLSSDLWCLLLDVNANNTAGFVAEETFLWAEDQLHRAQEAGVTVIAVSHQPVLLHNNLFTYGFAVGNNDRLLALYEKYHVQLNLSGHLHMQHIALSGSLADIAASSLAVSPNQYGVLRTKDGKLLEYSMQPLDVDAWAARTGQTDPNLLGFSAYSADFFKQTTFRQNEAMFEGRALSQEEQTQLAEFAAELNAEYFSGRRRMTSEDPRWAQWQTLMPDAFFTYYMGSILAEPPQDMTRFPFPSGAE